MDDKKLNIMITGGAGYIGSHVVKQLLETTKYNIFVLDNLSTGKKETLDILQTIKSFKFFQLDLKEFDEVNTILKNCQIDVILHFAASSIVSESMQNPMKYYINNTINTTNLIKNAISNNVKKFIFSSTAAVYGNPSNIPEEGLNEDILKQPINPYGSSKLMSEIILQNIALVNKNFKYIIFRYFNVAGADMFFKNSELSPRIGECHNPETHLVPLVAKTALKIRDKITIFGDNYNTFDGTCIRDYIHVDDLANAHIQAISYLNKNKSDIFNVGYGKGYSVKEVIETMKKTTKINFKTEIQSKREGDPSILIANNLKIINQMQWEPKYNNLSLICKSALEWEKKNKENK